MTKSCQNNLLNPSDSIPCVTFEEGSSNNDIPSMSEVLTISTGVPLSPLFVSRPIVYGRATERTRRLGRLRTTLESLPKGKEVVPFEISSSLKSWYSELLDRPTRNHSSRRALSSSCSPTIPPITFSVLSKHSGQPFQQMDVARTRSSISIPATCDRILTYCRSTGSFHASSTPR